MTMIVVIANHFIKEFFVEIRKLFSLNDISLELVKEICPSFQLSNYFHFALPSDFLPSVQTAKSIFGDSFSVFSVGFQHSMSRLWLCLV